MNLHLLLLIVLTNFLPGVTKEDGISNINNYNRNYNYIPFSGNDKQESPGEFVGETTREFRDETRSNWIGTAPRPLRVIIWYPGDSSSAGEVIDDGFQKISLVKEAKISSKVSKYPLVILSPGSGQKASGISWLGYYLSSHGFITVAISHNGTPEEERQQGGSMTLSDFCIWERPADISFVLTSILKDPVFGSIIDKNRIGAAGFSLGGGAVIWSAGGRINLDSLKKGSPSSPPQLTGQINRFIELSKTDAIIKKSREHAEDLFKDTRIKAVFALAPAVGPGFTKEGLSEVSVPVKIVAGDKDLIAPAEHNAKHYAGYIKNASLIMLPGERGHYLGNISNTHRSIELGEVSKIASEFFNKTLTP